MQFEQMVGPSAGGHGKAGGGGGGWREIPFKEGEAFEVNNLIRHRVTQAGLPPPPLRMDRAVWTVPCGPCHMDRAAWTCPPQGRTTE